MCLFFAVNFDDIVYSATDDADNFLDPNFCTFPLQFLINDALSKRASKCNKIVSKVSGNSNIIVD